MHTCSVREIRVALRDPKSSRKLPALANDHPRKAVKGLRESQNHREGIIACVAFFLLRGEEDAACFTCGKTKRSREGESWFRSWVMNCKASLFIFRRSSRRDRGVPCQLPESDIKRRGDAATLKRITRAVFKRGSGILIN